MLQQQSGWRPVLQQRTARIYRSKYLPEDKFLQLKGARNQVLDGWINGIYIVYELAVKILLAGVAAL